MTINSLKDKLKKRSIYYYLPKKKKVKTLFNFDWFNSFYGNLTDSIGINSFNDYE